MGTDSRPMRLSSPTVKVVGFLTPSMRISQLSGSWVISSGGGLRLLRTKRRSRGVIRPSPNALRLVSMVLALWMNNASGFFQAAYSGRVGAPLLSLAANALVIEIGRAHV